MKKSILYFILLFVLAACHRQYSHSVRKISIDKLRNSKGIEDSIFYGIDCNKYHYHVVEFEMYYAAFRQDGIFTKTTGLHFNDTMKNFIQQAKSGDLFNFNSIKAMGTDSMMFQLPDITFIVK